MRQVFFFLSIVLASSYWYSCSPRVLRADKYLDKNDLAKAKKRIDKAFAKEPKSPATHFMLAKYFSHPVWSYDAVDSAYYYFKLVSDSFPQLDSELEEKLSKKGLDSVAIATQGIIIDSLAFEAAYSKNTEQAYNEYLQHYDYLVFEEKATELRNQVAYTDAIAQNTTEAVSEFFRKYPDAPQAQKARNVFETLYYEKKTQNQSVEEYQEYLEERPQSEYAEEAALKLLKIISAGADEKTLQEFADQYENFEASNIANLLLRGLRYERQLPELITHKKDSLFYFYDLKQNDLLPLQLENVNPDSCSFILQPYILNLKNNEPQAYLKSGEKLTDDNIKEINYLGNGFFKINNFGRMQLIKHFSQQTILEQKGLDFQMLGAFHFARKNENGWQLNSLMNESILKKEVDSIWLEEEIFFFKEGSDIAVAAVEDFTKSSKNDLKSLSFLYDDYEWISDGLLRLYSNDYETVIDDQAQVIIPLEKAHYKLYSNFWVKETNGRFSVLDKSRDNIFAEEFEDFQYKSGVLALQEDSTWAVLYDGIKSFPIFKYDSIRIFNSWLTYATQDSAEYLLFRSGKKVKINEGQVFKLLKNYNVELSDVSSQIRFVELSNEKGYIQLYNGFGTKIKEGDQLDINVLTPKLIQIYHSKQNYLIDSSALNVEIKDVEAFGAYQNGLIPILQNKKFGALIVNSFKIIPAHSQSKLDIFLKDSLYIFKEDMHYGISDASANIILEADFERIEFFNDSTAIVEEEGEIGILDIYRNEYLHEGIEALEKLMLGNEDYFVLRKRAGYGVLNNTGKEVVPFIFNEIQSFETKGSYFWLAERRLSEINYIVIAYFDKNGQVLFKEGLNFDDYLDTTCD